MSGMGVYPRLDLPAPDAFARLVAYGIHHPRSERDVWSVGKGLQRNLPHYVS